MAGECRAAEEPKLRYGRGPSRRFTAFGSVLSKHKTLAGVSGQRHRKTPDRFEGRRFRLVRSLRSTISAPIFFSPSLASSFSRFVAHGPGGGPRDTIPVAIRPPDFHLGEPRSRVSSPSTSGADERSWHLNGLGDVLLCSPQVPQFLPTVCTIHSNTQCYGTYTHPDIVGYYK